MTRIIRFALLAIVCTLPLFTGCHPGIVEEKTAHLSYRCVSAEEGRQILLSNTAYFNSLTQNDIDWKYRSTGKTLDEFKNFAASQIQDFTDDEKKVLDAIVTSLEARFNELGIGLPTSDEITFIKSDMEDEGGAGGFTHGKDIYLNSFLLETIAQLQRGEAFYSPDYDEYFIRLGPTIVAHELFHCLTRNDARFRERLYSLIGFSVMDHNVEFGPTVRNLILANPDVERFDNWAEFTIGGVKRRCILVTVYGCGFAEAAATDPGASFFDYMQSVLVPLDNPDTMIPIEQASDFYQVLGQNTDYVIAAEECLADNFGYLFGYGLNGHYEYIDDKCQFVPYQTPQLIHNMHKALQELFPQ